MILCPNVHKILIILAVLVAPSKSEFLGIKAGRTFLHRCRGGDVTSPNANVITNEASIPETSNVASSPSFSVADNSAETEDDMWRQELPVQLQKRRGALHKILVPTGVTSNVGGIQEEELCEVYLLGTAHVSKDSCEDVKLLMDYVQPDVLFVELCNNRLAVLEDEPPLLNATDSIADNGKTKGVGEMTKEIMIHNPGMTKAAALSSVLLTKIQGDYATKLGVTIGGEFREAYKKAVEQQKTFNALVETLRWEKSTYGKINEETLRIARLSNGCSVVLGDRPVRLTLLRAWEALSIFGKIKLVVALAWSSLRQPSDEELREWMESIMNDPTNDILTKSIEELSKHFPAVKRTIIEERDVFMACKIIQTSRIMGTGSAQDGLRRKLVVVVGAGHCPGISKILRNESEGDVGLRISTEGELKKVIETKKHKIEDPDVMSLVNEVTSMEPITS
eukprot:444193_1